MPDFRSETRAAIEAVQIGLARATESVGEVATKAGRDIVTATDIAVEDAMRRSLSRSLAIPVIGEERGGDVPADGSSYWLIDPICGTRNFASGIPLYCVNLAMVEDGRVSVAVVGDPSRGELVIAEAGEGTFAFRDGVLLPLRTSDLSRSLVIEEGKSGGKRRRDAGRLMTAVVQADRWDFRSLGSTLALPYLAAGRISAYGVVYVTSIHCAAGALLVTEAGGTVSQIDGRPWTLRSDSLLASADAGLHQELLGLLHAE